MKKFISVAGNIGVGKSTLVDLLCARLGWEPFFEGVVDNPYLADFYEDMAAWSFHSQVFFLSRRLRDLRRLMDYPRTAVQDRSVYEDAEIFAKNLHRQGFITKRDWNCYRELYLVLTELLPPPDLVVYLQATVPTLLRRISLRGRDYEKQISGEYLSQLDALYEEWLRDFKASPVLVVPADRLDFVANGDHLDLIVAKIQDKLRGEQLVLFD
ncbi:MAG: deoxynucleoside kinase [Chloroflexi bacterium]|nr:deoxynucleoside kinase [Chloroflexota bacterium]